MKNSRLTPTMTYRDLCRLYVGPDATDPELDWLWFHVGLWPFGSPYKCEERLAAWCAESDAPLERIHRARARLAASGPSREQQSARRLAELRELCGLRGRAG